MPRHFEIVFRIVGGAGGGDAVKATSSVPRPQQNRYPNLQFLLACDPKPPIEFNAMPDGMEVSDQSADCRQGLNDPDAKHKENHKPFFIQL